MRKPTYTLRIGGLESTTENPVGGVAWCVVERDVDVPADALVLHLLDLAGIAVGDPVTLELGYDGSEERVFTGTVAALRATAAGHAVQALGRMAALLALRASGTFEDQSAGAIASDLIGRAGLDAGTVADGPVLPRFAVDRGASAFAHLRGLAERLGYELYALREGKVCFHAPGEPAAGSGSGGPGGLAAAAGLLGGAGGTAAYRFGEQAIRLEAARRPGGPLRVEVGGESPMSSQGARAGHWLTVNDADYRGAAGDGERVVLEMDGAARTKDLADLFAEGRLARARGRAHRVTVVVPGRAAAELGEPAATDGAPEPLLNGQGWVRRIRHDFGARRGFTTELCLTLAAGG